VTVLSFLERLFASNLVEQHVNEDEEHSKEAVAYMDVIMSYDFLVPLLQGTVLLRIPLP